MKLWQAEKEAFDALPKAQTLEDFVRIGFNSVRVELDEDNHIWVYEMVGDHTCGGMGVNLDGRTPAELDGITTDDDGYHVIYVKLKGQQLL